MDATRNTHSMPIANSRLAPRFSGNPYEVLDFLNTVDQLRQHADLPENIRIKYALKYMDYNERELWQTCEECTGNNYEDFANTILDLYPEIGRRYVRPESPDPMSDPMHSSQEPEASKVQEKISESATISETHTKSEELEVSEAVYSIVVSANPIFGSDAPEISDMIFGHINSASENSETFVETVETNVLTSETQSIELKLLGHDIPENFGSDHSEIRDIDIGASDYELGQVVCQSDITDNFVLAAIATLAFTGYVYFCRIISHQSGKETPQSPSETPERPPQSNPKISDNFLKVYATVSLTRCFSYQVRKFRHKYPVNRSYQYCRPSHSRIAFDLYESR
ncbi:uncharacterized protein F5147DRAFT_769180 [Suillus discolor]|uniref:Uncharacterized protein n=1 Tax=Suillus discolor TaxID=1912936 RepID=A0A9P7JY44_9AGAM|nr:uncharacterized protein F5147DRAFT_769180 [Suillus discolor]KAG2115751.1 hypothetical protein F5147DRAFT_769180 [Suillus discolor]